jgi:tetratricopeptide (TPR) repeat protein
LAAIEEAVEIKRCLAEAYPDAFLFDLAGSLNNKANRLGELGRLEQALAAIEEAVEIYRSLVAVHPDAFLPDLAMSLHNVSNILHDLGRRQDALSAIEEAVVSILPLLESAPYVLPDAGLRLIQRYLAAIEVLDRVQDDELVGRMIDVLTRAGVVNAESGESDAPET